MPYVTKAFFQWLDTLHEGNKPTTREARIVDGKGNVIFSKTVIAPSAWSDTAVGIFASKYLAPQDGNAISDACWRIASTISRLGRDFVSKLDRFMEGNCGNDYMQVSFDGLLFRILYNQIASFNSPVWFNVGVQSPPQCSACFINDVEDSLDSIMELAETETRIFKGGSGSGVNFSALRAKDAPLSKGGKSSGVMSFIKALDAMAGAIKSGGRTRRAAKIVILNHDHPDIEEFVRCKIHEEEKIRALVSSGVSREEAIDSVAFQNGNNSVRLMPSFWGSNGLPAGEREVKLLLDIAHAIYEVGDPGVQFHDNVNANNPYPTEITGSNPCAEFVAPPNNACNLASINLMMFRTNNNTFEFPFFAQTCEIMLLAQDILVDMSSYPNKEIQANSVKYRPLGLGYSNLGALLMSNAIPYGSEKAQKITAEITRSMAFAAWNASCLFAKALDASSEAPRNYQRTLLAPTATISLIMDCETTGIEPPLGLVETKTLVGGGQLQKTYRSLVLGLEALGRSGAEIKSILSHVEKTGALPSDLAPLFPTALGSCPVKPQEHLAMMAAAQKHLCGAISKTVNLPAETTRQEIYDLIIEAHRLGLKSLALYRDGSKVGQPLEIKRIENKAEVVEVKKVEARKRLPQQRNSITRKFTIGGVEGYATVGLYPNGSIGELFLRVSKGGSTISGMLDAFATAVSIALQSGVSLDTLAEKFIGTTFDPKGFTDDAKIKTTSSILDFVFRWMNALNAEATPLVVDSAAKQETGMLCNTCGNPLYRAGTCMKCNTCGETSGCS